MGAQGGVEYSEDVPDNKFSVWCFGHKRIPRTKGTTTYAIAPNRVRIGYLFYNKAGSRTPFEDLGTSSCMSCHLSWRRTG
ncbi:uncharacterized protein MYCGRDRAFT_102788 [Zymoseptoria tritici IPO323]|uniref:Uncharacterized protein n=1 Tax=Zymoseptoria tritici (strain CBS 115943 / IPO323) TaxID=336722 RepID=F9X1F0_ZYMTI|nr:uncharacterized protein MYCGRDRAFT_102788 [Zymoseptoria tritici IPO323]EGP92065.1 hypothetical protein MYCGRDRAFT_102788 [Zymoseptoria tritici IPO323]